VWSLRSGAVTYDPHASAVPHQSSHDDFDSTDLAESAAPFPDPDAIKQQSFSETHHGYDPDEVHAFLVTVAESLHDAYGREAALTLRVADLQRALDDAEHRASTAEHEAIQVAEDAAAIVEGNGVASLDRLDEGELAVLVGEETAKVLAAARNAASGIVTNAERTASQMRNKAGRDAERLVGEAQEASEATAREADAEAERRLTEADTAIGLARADAERRAAEIVAAAEASVADVQADANHRLEVAAMDAAAIVDEANIQARAVRDQAEVDARALVAEAHAMRARMLEELLRRRKLLRQQVEQLQAGRDRLALAFGVVHESMVTIDLELGGVLADARAQAEAAVARVEMSADSGAPEVQAMIDVSREAAGLDPGATEDLVSASEHDPSGSESSTTGDLEQRTLAVDEAASLFSLLKVESTVEGEASHPGPGSSPDSRQAEDLTPPRDASTPESDEPPCAGSEAEPDTTTGAASDEPEAVPTAGSGTDGETDIGTHTGSTHTGSTHPDALGDAAEPVPVQGSPISDTDDVANLCQELTGELTRAVGRRMKRLLTDEQNELLDAVRKARPLPSLEELLSVEAEHERRYAEAAVPALRRAAVAGQELLGMLAETRHGEPGTSASTVSPTGDRDSAQQVRAAAPINIVDLAAVLAVDVVSPLRQRLEQCMSGPGAQTLRAAPAAGHSGATKAERRSASDQLSGDVRLAYREIRNRNVDTAAAEAVRDAVARGVQASVADSETTRAAEILAVLAT